MKVLRAWLVRVQECLAGFGASGRFPMKSDSHLEMHVDENLRAGMTSAQARRDALLKLGGVETAKQAYRERGTVPLLEELWFDVRYAFRQLGRNPGFACTAILTLSLGICASVAIFAFVDATLIRPLPYRNPPGLVDLFESRPSGLRFHLSYLDYLDWKRVNTVFSSLEAFDGNNYLLNAPTGVQQAEGATVSAGFFGALGVTPILGRDFRDGEDAPSAPALFCSAISHGSGATAKTLTFSVRRSHLVGRQISSSASFRRSFTSLQLDLSSFGPRCIALQRRIVANMASPRSRGSRMASLFRLPRRTWNRSPISWLRSIRMRMGGEGLRSLG